MNHLILIDSIQINECYKDGKPKLCGLTKIYKHGEFYYEMNVGKHTRFYKSGSKTISIYDDWGTNLSNTYYDAKGHLVMEQLTTKIETNASNLDVFLDSKNHMTFDVYFNNYSYDFKLCKYYLRKEGQYSNGKKVGVWKFYLPTGRLKKEKSY
ncbi:hypothetical protein [Winogradskyella psychrotolerans]|uniref:hypothetical protein n=1 Tax=Winogradskyella psychrotolerans TaxID=1344585 RepID=UPI001C07DCBF|nr:hypothetical protein [Winogradskyella psychrotolerans]MBU2929993.1 hypothetical protein [Winogradskyella psychrotolerans]